MINVIAAIYFFIWYLIVFVTTFTIVLMLIRLIFDSLDVNPFTWHAMMTRRLSDPFINPVKHGMRNAGLSPKYAAIVTILLVILVGFFTVQLVAGLLNITAGVLLTAKAGIIIGVVGYVIYGLLSLYGLMIFLRIIFSWGMIGYGNRVMRFLINWTDPLLLPLRRRIRPVGMLDISPLVAFIIIWILQVVVQRTLLRGLSLNYFG
jgi:YggT family protein